MFVSESLNINEKGHLTIGGIDTVDLAKEYATPCYVMDEDLIRKNARTYKNAIDTFYNGNGLVLYASKAFSCKYIYKVMQEEGLGVDVVSGGELYTAVKAGFDTSKIYFHGNNKTYDELELAVKCNIGRIVVDNISELERLDEIASNNNTVQKILFRIKPGVDAHTHDFIKTGQIDCKFGFAIENGEAIEIIRKVKDFKNVEFCGIHCHIGSQIFDVAPFEETADVMMNFVSTIKKETGFECNELNLGGGFGCKYIESDDPIEYDKYIESVSHIVKAACEKHGVKVPFILMEPGRSIVASAGITLYTVGAIKDIKNVRKYIMIDGGMADNPRYILYQAQYSAVIANNATATPSQKVTIAGKCCESGDLIAENIMMGEIKVNDTLAVLTTGAYNYSMSSNYNRIPRPPVVMVSQGKSKVVIKRETYDDIIKNDL